MNTKKKIIHAPDLAKIEAALQRAGTRAREIAGKTRTPFIIDEFVKSRKSPFFVIPAKTGIQSFQSVTEGLDYGFHQSDDFLRDRHNLQGWKNKEI